MDTDSKAPDVSGETNQDENADNKGQSQSADAICRIVSESSVPANSTNDVAAAEEIPHHSHYKILDDAMSTPTSAETGRAYVHPVLFDCLLACGLLVAMGGFTIGLLKDLHHALCRAKHYAAQLQSCDRNFKRRTVPGFIHSQRKRSAGPFESSSLSRFNGKA